MSNADARLVELGITLPDPFPPVGNYLSCFGMVNVGGSFDQTPAVIDGCSDLLVEVFGLNGRHTRSAVGLAALPFGIAVEIELIAHVT